MKEQILKTAKKLKQPNDASVRAFDRSWEKLAAIGTQILIERPDLEKLIGKDNGKMAEDNNRNFPRFMLSLFLDYKPEVLVETVLWVFRAYRSHGFHTTYWAANLNIWLELLKKELSPEAFNEISPFYSWLIVNIPAFVNLTDADLAGNELYPVP